MLEFVLPTYESYFPGLIVPPKCFLDVDGEKQEWKEGEVIVFDDSFSHSVEHNGTKEDGIRAVLMFDIWHPQVDKERRYLLNYIFAPE